MIIWIDDDTSITLDVFMDELKDAGADILRVSETNRALETVKEKAKEIDGIILDIMMPMSTVV